MYILIAKEMAEEM